MRENVCSSCAARPGRFPRARLRNDPMTITTFADVTDGTDQPIPGTRRTRHFQIICLRIPNDAIGPFPSVARPRFAGVLRIEVVAVHGDIVPQRPRRPAMM